MYAAAGGASLASRQARRKQKLHHTNESMHQQFHKRFQQLQHQHAPACAEGYHYMRSSSSGLLSPSHLPSCTDLHGRGTAIDFNLQEHLLEGKSPSVFLEREKKDSYSPFVEIAPPLVEHEKLKTSDVRKWAKRHKMHDSSFGGSSLDVRSGLHRQYDAAANMLLYVGLCAVALGLVIAFVGTGEKGFKTVQLRLIGPTMIGCGTFCCFLRILFCFCPTRCMRKRFKHRQKVTGPLSDAAQLNKHGLTADDQARLEYYKHLPFQTPMANNFLLFEQPPLSMMKDGKKRVSIAPHTHNKRIALIGHSRAAPDSKPIIDEASSDTLSTLREMSPPHEEDLIDFQQSSNSYENLPSLDSSLEYLNEQLRDDEVDTRDRPLFNTEEQIQRLKSTLTFRDSTDLFPDSRLMMSYDDFDLIRDDRGGKKNEDEQMLLNEGSQELVLDVGKLEKKK